MQGCKEHTKKGIRPNHSKDVSVPWKFPFFAWNKVSFWKESDSACMQDKKGTSVYCRLFSEKVVLVCECVCVCVCVLVYKLRILAKRIYKKGETAANLQQKRQVSTFFESVF